MTTWTTPTMTLKMMTIIKVNSPKRYFQNDRNTSYDNLPNTFDDNDDDDYDNDEENANGI